MSALMDVNDDGSVRLRGSSCDDCRRPSFPRADVCTWCGSAAVTPVLLSDRGTLWGWAVVHSAPPGYDGPVPYGMGVVELPEGLRVVTRVDIGDESALDFGLPVRFVAEDVAEPGDGEPFLAWSVSPC